MSHQSSESSGSPQSQLKPLDEPQHPQAGSPRVRDFPARVRDQFQAKPVADRHWYIVGFNKDGQEVSGGAHPSLTSEDSDRIVAELRRAQADAAPYTDVFVISHGWKHTEQQAIMRYEEWIQCMIDAMPDVFRKPDKKVLLVCVYWPSAPIDDDVLSVRAPAEIFKFPSKAQIAQDRREVIAKVQESLGVDPEDVEAGKAIDTLLAKSGEDPQATKMLLSRVAHRLKAVLLDPRREPASPEAAQQPLELSRNTPPDQFLTPWNVTSNPRILLASTLLRLKSLLGLRNDSTVIRELSFWLMRDRAITVGETGVHALLKKLKVAAGDGARFHLMGHSFGCSVMSAALTGRDSSERVSVDTLYLVQGALSLWSYAYHVPLDGEHIPPPPIEPRRGYYNAIPSTPLVRGALVTTYSKHDRAVRIFWPAAESLPQPASFDIVRWFRQKLGYGPPVLANWPDFGAVGAYGVRDLWMSPRQAAPPGAMPAWIAQGAATPTQWQSVYMGDAKTSYGFERGRIYNLCADAYICKMESVFSGAHNMIVEPPVAHAFWEAVTVA